MIIMYKTCVFTGDPTSVQKTLGPFDDQRRRRERDCQEENDSACKENKKNVAINIRNTGIEISEDGIVGVLTLK